MPYTTLLFDVRDRVATVTVNRPDKLNALNDATIAELGAAFGEVAARDDIGGVIITGAGTRAFVAGADIAELATQGAVRRPRARAAGADGLLADRAVGEAGDRGGERLRAGRRLRARARVPHPHRLREREVRARPR